MQHPGTIDRVALFQVTPDAPQEAVRNLGVLGASYPLSDLRDEFEESVTTLRGASTQSRRNSGMSRGDDNGVEDIEPRKAKLTWNFKVSLPYTPSWNVCEGGDKL